jgi:endoglycosylceramidase
LAIRAIAPTAILFIEGQVLCSSGTQSQLPRPTFANYAYAAHFYDALVLALGSFSGLSTLTDLGFATMNTKAASWNVPLFVGEFGSPAGTTNGLSYIDLLYQRLDDYQASGTYWNYTPGWTAVGKDGWNGEDFSLIDDHAQPRATFRYRPYARRIPGTPTALTVTHAGAFSSNSIEVKWVHDPARGQLEVYLPRRELWGATPLKLELDGAGIGCWFADERTFLCQSTSSGPKRIKVRPCIKVFGVCL